MIFDIVTQPVQARPAKLPVPKPMLAAPTKVTDVAVNVSVPSNDSSEPAAINTADAGDAQSSGMAVSVAAAVRARFFIAEYPPGKAVNVF